jgi:hypothetical protein
MNEPLAYALFIIFCAQVVSFIATNRHIDEVRDEIMGKKP